MIKLDIAPYCQKCGSFEAETHHETLFCGSEPYEDIITVFCRNADKCRGIYDYILSDQSENSRKLHAS